MDLLDLMDSDGRGWQGLAGIRQGAGVRWQRLAVAGRGRQRLAGAGRARRGWHGLAEAGKAWPGLAKDGFP